MQYKKVELAVNQGLDPTTFIKQEPEPPPPDDNVDDDIEGNENNPNDTIVTTRNVSSVVPGSRLSTGYVIIIHVWIAFRHLIGSDF